MKARKMQEVEKAESGVPVVTPSGAARPEANSPLGANPLRHGLRRATSPERDGSTLSVISLRSMPAPPKGELFGIFR